MNRTRPSRTASLALRGGLAVAFLASCARTTSPRTQAPTPGDEVSVGYGTQSKPRVTGTVTSICPNEADTRVPRLVDLLQGRVPGLDVLRLPGETYSLRIRGAPSSGQNPTYDEP